MAVDEIDIEREYVEIYPVRWRTLQRGDVEAIFASRSHDKIGDITLYLHIPFCPQICAFCGFNKVPFRDALYRRYVAALRREIGYYREHPDLDGRQVSAVYFGGGTASTLTSSDLAILLTDLRSVFRIADAAEITIEGHPNTLELTKLQEYAALGVNRLSIGVQSFSDRKLRSIGRRNTAAENERVLGDAKRAGIPKVSIDLMYRLPHETIDELVWDLERIVFHRPANVSAYSLIVEGTKFESRLSMLPEFAIESEMAELIRETLLDNGYVRWSNNDFALPGGITQYNINYWRAPQTLLLGLGAGAHTHYFGQHAWTNVYAVGSYTDALQANRFPGMLGQSVSPDELMHRYMVMGAHCLEVGKGPFQYIFGRPLDDVFGSVLRHLEDRGWLESRPDSVVVTQAGMPYINNIKRSFFSSASRDAVQPWSMGLTKLVPSGLVPMSGEG